MTIKVGDVVSWGSGKNPNAMRFTRCIVLELGEFKGERFAKLNLGRFGHANAWLTDLELEQPTQESK